MSYIRESWRDDENVKKVEVDGLRMFIKGNALLGAELINPADGRKNRFTARIPEGVEFVMESAFEGLPISGVIFPNGLKHIAARAFARTPLKEVSFPSTLEIVGERAFQSCKQLRKVIFPKSLEFLDAYSFSHDWNLGECSYAGGKEDWLSIFRSPYWNYSSHHIVITCQDERKIDYTIDYDGFLSFEQEWNRRPSEKRVPPPSEKSKQRAENQNGNTEKHYVAMTMGQMLKDKNAIVIHPTEERPTPVVYTDSITGVKIVLGTDYLMQVKKFRLVLDTPPEGMKPIFVLFTKRRLDNEPVLPSVVGRDYVMYYGTVYIAGYDEKRDVPRPLTDEETVFVARNMAYLDYEDNRCLVLHGYEEIGEGYLV